MVPDEEDGLTDIPVLFGESAEMYLKTIAELTSSENLAPISQVAERMDVSPVSATEMIHRLQARDLVEHVPYRGVHLTDYGRNRATAVIRRHRLWEVFLVEKLSIAWSQVHGLACRLEHASDSGLTNRLATYLGNPRNCPHGNPIPDASGDQAEPSPGAVPLSDIELGAEATVVRIHPESDSLLEHLEQRGLLPGAEIRVEEKAILDGPLSMSVKGEIQIVGRGVAAYVLVMRTERG